MAYKPLSQTVTNGKDKEIASSDAVFDAIAAANPFPSQTSNTDKVLVTNGTTVSWEYSGLGSGSFPTNSLILGKAKPAGFTSTNALIIGTGTAGNSSTGTDSIFIGHNAGASTTGQRNTVIGVNANITTGNESVVIGESAIGAASQVLVVGARARVNGSVGIALGPSASVGSGTYGITIGTSAGRAASTGPDNIIIGTNAGYDSLSSGQKNILIGSEAGRKVSTGSNNVSIGDRSGDVITTGSDNILLGKDAGGGISTGIQNFFFGSDTGGFITTGSSNIALGHNALFATNNAVSDNISIGRISSYGSTGSRNIVIGPAIGNYFTGTSGNNSIVLGVNHSLGNLSNICSIGSADPLYGVRNFYLGAGAGFIASNVAAGHYTRITNVRVSGANQSPLRAQLILQGAESTGTGAGGPILFETVPKSITAGSTTNSGVLRMGISAAGATTVVDTTLTPVLLADSNNLVSSLSGAATIVPVLKSQQFQVETGSNASAGIATILNGTSEVTVTTNKCTADSIILVTNQTSTAYVSVTTKGAGSFKIAHANNVGADQSCAWFIINPALSSDSDVAAFFNATSGLTFLEKYAVDLLVTELKSASLWTKFKAIYPFVGKSFNNHKLNLKNPVDSDAAFRLVKHAEFWDSTMTGEFTHNGLQVNNTGAGAGEGYNTKILPSADLTAANDYSFVLYLNGSTVRQTGTTPLPFHSGYAIKANSPSNTLGISTYRLFGVYNNASFRSGSTSNVGSATNYTESANGLHILSSTASGVTYYIEGQSAATGTSLADFSSFTNRGTSGSHEITFAGQNSVNHVGFTYGLVAIGDGLSSTDVTALVPIIQKYQLRLGRAV